MATSEVKREARRPRKGPRPPLPARIREWVNERINATPLIGAFLYRQAPKGAGWWYTFGSTTLFLFILQITNGAVGKRLSASWVVSHFEDPALMPPGMSRFQLSNEDLMGLTAYLLSRKKKESPPERIPVFEPLSPAAAAGTTIFDSLCNVCHPNGGAGIGPRLFGDDFQPAVWQRSRPHRPVEKRRRRHARLQPGADQRAADV
ncbi:MAG: cytochrome c [Chloroflexi bacterium]|nr:cytochrome c [Chloroflexota bacterium]